MSIDHDRGDQHVRNTLDGDLWDEVEQIVFDDGTVLTMQDVRAADKVLTNDSSGATPARNSHLDDTNLCLG